MLKLTKRTLALEPTLLESDNELNLTALIEVFAEMRATVYDRAANHASRHKQGRRQSLNQRPARLPRGDGMSLTS